MKGSRLYLWDQVRHIYGGLGIYGTWCTWQKAPSDQKRKKAQSYCIKKLCSVRKPILYYPRDETHLLIPVV